MYSLIPPISMSGGVEVGQVRHNDGLKEGLQIHRDGGGRRGTVE